VRILVIDVGGTHIKLLATGQPQAIKIPSGPDMTPKRMVHLVRGATAGWRYDAVSIGYPGPVINGRPAEDPRNIGKGWVGFNFRRAFGCPIRLVNDAAMQALGSYPGGGRMLFLGLGTGLGTAMVVEGHVAPMELQHLPFKKGRTYEQYVGAAGLKRLGKKKWRRNVLEVITLLRFAMQADTVVVGGGNAKLLHALPRGVHLGRNANAFVGGFRLWTDPSLLARRRAASPSPTPQDHRRSR
jgi:predicted NBD/HSP70 family sugar kinase